MPAIAMVTINSIKVNPALFLNKSNLHVFYDDPWLLTDVKREPPLKDCVILFFHSAMRG
jgi:hypothetical protein